MPDLSVGAQSCVSSWCFRISRSHLEILELYTTSSHIYPLNPYALFTIVKFVNLNIFFICDRFEILSDVPSSLPYPLVSPSLLLKVFVIRESFLIFSDFFHARIHGDGFESFFCLISHT